MSDRRKSPVVPLVVAAVAVLALVATLVGTRDADDTTEKTSATTSSQSTEPNKAPDDTWERLVRREADDPMAMGEVDAPVVMLAYSEFQCPFCGKFARDTAPTLIKQYVEKGMLRIEWRDFPYLGPESTTAAEAGRAAAAQDSFWAFHDRMYARQLPPNSGDLDEGHVVGIAKKLDLDLEKFRSDMKSESTQRAIAADFSQGQAIGVTGTPAFVINGVPIIGAQPTEVFEQAIEQAASEAG